MKPRNEKLQQTSIIIVDDTPANLELLSGMLKQKGYRVRPAPSGKLAIQAAIKDKPDLILLDISMPEMDGYEVCTLLKADPNLRDIPVIFISALTETIDKVRAFSNGGVDYITKPFQFEEVNARVETHLKLRRLQIELERHNLAMEDTIKKQVMEISDSQMSTIFALAKLSESRDDDTGRHLERVQVFCRMLSEKLYKLPGYCSVEIGSFIENITQASPLHDIGKVGIPDAILLKPGKLTSDEFDQMKTHTVIGARTLESVSLKYTGNQFIKTGIEISMHHHERWDGRGYPDALAGDAIPLSARVMSVADVYDALRSTRCYKTPLSHEESRNIILSGAGTQFDPVLVDVFDSIHEQFRYAFNNLRSA
jgi:putative two-component system response regulator